VTAPATSVPAAPPAATPASPAGPAVVSIGWATSQRDALFAAVIGGSISVLLGLVSQATFFHAYLIAYVLILGVTLGSLVLLMIQYMTGGVWGLALRRILEANTRTMPAVAFLFVPIALGAGYIYPWFNEALFVEPPTGESLAGLVVKQRTMLNMPVFLGATLVYFAVFGVLAYLLNQWSAETDRSADPVPLARCSALSGPGLLLYALLITLASIHWVMSIEPLWASTMYPLLFGMSQILTAYAFSVLVLLSLADSPPFNKRMSSEWLRDIASLFLAFVMLWAYMSISQFLLVWSANLREEVPWYVKRMTNGWEFVGMALIGLHFALPFILLQIRRLARSPRYLYYIALGVLVMRVVDVIWWIEPGFVHLDLASKIVPWIAIPSAIAGLGGLWFWLFLLHVSRRPLLPAHDPYLHKMVPHHHE
jgi:hypothetical protein